MNKSRTVVFALGALAAGCALEPQSERGEAVESAQEALYIDSSTLWKPRNIPVCFASGGTAQERAWIRAGASEWAAQDAAAIEFVGWRTCSSSDPKSKIIIRFADETPHTKGLGTDGGWNMTLNLRFNNWSTSCAANEASRSRCIRIIATHEFGHALGFAHEQNRPDTPAGYRDFCDTQGSSGTWMFGEWDENSVMNYCNPLWSNHGKLSPTDKAGARAAYGKKEYFPRMWSPTFGLNAGWNGDDYPRFVVDVGGSDLPDVVGFGDAGVWVSENVGTDQLRNPVLVVPKFGYSDGWRKTHVRTLADVNGDGKQDIVGFGNAGVYVSLNNSTATSVDFLPQTKWSDSYCNEDGWTVINHPRFMVDVNKDGNADIVGFANAGVYVSLSNGRSGFSAPSKWSDNYTTATAWTGSKHVRLVSDVDGDGLPDIVGFANGGTYVSKNLGSSFGTPRQQFASMGYEQGWRVGTHPRMLADVDGDRDLDIVGFGNAGAYVARNDGRGNFSLQQRPWIFRYGGHAGWGVQHPRFLEDVDGDGAADIVGFANAGLYVSLSEHTKFAPEEFRLREYGAQEDGWDVDDHPRVMADMNGDGRMDVVGFASNGVHVSLQ